MADITKNAAIVCVQVALEDAPILYAERSEPQDEADSGWQFLCGVIHEDWSTAQVWAIEEVLEKEPSLKHLIDSPVGTVLSRNSLSDQWQTIRD